MTIQEREEADYAAGCFSSELEAGFHLGQIERIYNPSDDRAAIREAVAAGKHVVYFEGPSYCPHTDAINGSIKSIIKVCETREDAEAHARAFDNRDDELSVVIEPRIVIPRQFTSCAPDQVPF